MEQDSNATEMIFRNFLNSKVCSRRILLSMILTQEDGKPNNYVMRAIPFGTQDSLGMGTCFRGTKKNFLKLFKFIESFPFSIFINFRWPILAHVPDRVNKGEDDGTVVMDNTKFTPVTFDIVSVDNERSFFPPIGMDGTEQRKTQNALGGSPQLMMKDFMLCLPIMEHQVNIFAASEFCALDMHQVLRSWIEETQFTVFPRILKIFSQQEIATFSPVTISACSTYRV